MWKRILNKKSLYSYIINRKYLFVLPFVFLLILFLHYINSLSFSFTDAYNSYARAYFLDKGRSLYAEIFSHHNMLMVYLSYAIQKVFNPLSMYKLVMVHQLSIAFLSVILALLFALRFRWVGIIFVLVFEITKYYLFGNLFLAEVLVVYMLAYLVGLAWEKLHKREFSVADMVFAGLFAFFIAFLREPFIPATGILFAYILFDKNFLKLKVLIVLSQIAFALLLISTVQFDEYFFHLITLNFSGYIQNEMETQGIAGLGIIKAFLYPIYIFIAGKISDFRIILIILSSIFTILSILYLRKRSILPFLFLIFVLGLANIRVREPGEVFYGAFHMLPWYGTFLFSLLLIARELQKRRFFIWVQIAIVISFSAVIAITFASSSSIFNRSVSREEEFTKNYGRFYVNGEIIKLLSDSDDKLFVDNWDTLVYWQSDLDSSYQYAMYFPVMTSVEKYAKARNEMFENNMPEFYYTDCGKNPEKIPLSHSVMNKYERIYYNNVPTCLLILKEKLSEINSEQWRKVNELGYDLPSK